jgi:hypothetical protein
MALLGPTIAGDQVGSAANVTVAARSWTDAPLFVEHPGSKGATGREASGARVGSGSADAAVQDLTALAPQSPGLFVRIAKRDAR